MIYRILIPLAGFLALLAILDQIPAKAAMAVIGPGLLLLAPLTLVRDTAFRRRALEKAPGTVVSCEEEGIDPPGWEYTLTVRFTALDGREHVITESGRPRRRPADTV
ncbi:hypothetical protein, partial [Actinomadura rubrisoli]